MNAHQEVESLLAQIMDAIHPNVMARSMVERLTDQISVLCRGYMTLSADDRWLKYGLTKAEGRLMSALEQRDGRLMAKGPLLDAIAFDKHDEPEIKIVDVLVCKIRKKLQGSPWSIETVWGQGYRAKYTAPAEQQKAA